MNALTTLSAALESSPYGRVAPAAKPAGLGTLALGALGALACLSRAAADAMTASRRPVDLRDASHIDRSTALYNMAGFQAVGDEMLAACLRDGRPLTVAVFDCADLLEVRAIYGSRMARKLLARIVAKLTALCAQRGLAARTGPAEFTVVLQGLGREKTLAAIQRVLGSPMRVELDAGDSEIVLVPECLIETAGDTESVAELHGELRRELARQQARELRRHHHMQRERERHSRPMGITGHGTLAAG